MLSAAEWTAEAYETAAKMLGSIRGDAVCHGRCCGALRGARATAARTALS